MYIDETKPDLPHSGWQPALIMYIGVQMLATPRTGVSQREPLSGSWFTARSWALTMYVGETIAFCA